MATANYQCSDCNTTKSITFNPGEVPAEVICEKCKKPMKRIWKNIAMTKVVDENVMEAGQAILRSGMATKDKLVY